VCVEGKVDESVVFPTVVYIGVDKGNCLRRRNNNNNNKRNK